MLAPPPPLCQTYLTKHCIFPQISRLCRVFPRWPLPYSSVMHLPCKPLHFLLHLPFTFTALAAAFATPPFTFSTLVAPSYFFASSVLFSQVIRMSESIEGRAVVGEANKTTVKGGRVWLDWCNCGGHMWCSIIIIFYSFVYILFPNATCTFHKNKKAG